MNEAKHLFSCRRKASISSQAQHQSDILWCDKVQWALAWLIPGCRSLGITTTWYRCPWYVTNIYYWRSNLTGIVGDSVDNCSRDLNGLILVCLQHSLLEYTDRRIDSYGKKYVFTFRYNDTAELFDQSTGWEDVCWCKNLPGHEPWSNGSIGWGSLCLRTVKHGKACETQHPLGFYPWLTRLLSTMTCFRCDLQESL